MTAIRVGWWAALAVGVLAAAAADEPAAPSDKVKERLGDKAVGLLQGATRVEVFRVAPEEAKPGEKSVGGYRVAATGAEQKKEFAGRLTAVLLKDETYFGTQSRCFLPGVAFRLWDEDKQSVDVVICFGCSNLRVIARDADGKEVKTAAGGFGPDKGALLKLAKEAFPDDRDIQGLTDEKK
jgi:hypothetical protein